MEQPEKNRQRPSVGKVTRNKARLKNHSGRVLTVLKRVTIECTLVDECVFLDVPACRGLGAFQPRRPLQFRKLQNSSLSANWICRWLSCSCLWTLPPLAGSENGVWSAVLPSNMLVFRPLPLKFGWFGKLKNSARNSSMPPSSRISSFVFFTTEKSQFLSGGPVRILRPAVPNWPIVSEQFVSPGPVQFGGIENMAELNQWLGSPVMTVLGS